MNDKEKKAIDDRWKAELKKAMSERGLTKAALAKLSGINKSNVNNAFYKEVFQLNASVKQVADYLGIDISWMPVPAVMKQSVTVKPIDNNRYFVRVLTSGGETCKIMTKEELTEKGYKMNTEVPTLTDESPELMLNEEKALWIDGQKYTIENVKKLIEDSVSDHRKLVELMDDNEKLEAENAELKREKLEQSEYIAKLEVENSDLYVKVEGLKASSKKLEDMTIGEGINQYRILGKIFRTEVLDV